MSNSKELDLISFDYHTAMKKYLSIFYNTSANIKEELQKHLIYESDLKLENVLRSDIRLNQKWELYALQKFHEAMMPQGQYSLHIESAIMQALGEDEQTNYKCVVSLKKFQQLFEKKLGECSKIVFSLIDIGEFFQKYFGQLLYVPEEGEEQEEQLLKIKGIAKLFREKYEFKIKLRKFLDLGLRIALMFLEEAKEFYGRAFKAYD